MNDKEQMDQHMYNASVHIVAAAKYMAHVSPPFATQLANTALRLLNVIDAPTEKMDVETMDSIMAEILALGAGDK